MKPPEEYVVFTKEQFEAGLEEMGSMMFHGAFLARRALGEPVQGARVILDVNHPELYE